MTARAASSDASRARRRGTDTLDPTPPESPQELTDALQQSLLPRLPRRLPGADLAFRYLPGNNLLQVGGDWFDVMALPGKRIGLVIGDVTGHNVTSATVMGRLRTAMETLAFLGLPPHTVLRHLDDAARRLSDTHLATCLYGIYDPVTRGLRIANAGHLPPILIRRGDPTAPLELPTGVPIGVGGHRFETVEFHVEDGDTLLLYTDGLVEDPRHDIDDGIQALCETAPGACVPLEQVCDTILDGMGIGVRCDDVALIAVRFHSVPDEHVATWPLQPVHQAAKPARDLIRRKLEEWGLSGLTTTAELLVDEIVGDGDRSTYRPVRLRMLRTDTLTCEFHEDGHPASVPLTLDAFTDADRRLPLTDKLAVRWGTDSTDTGKVLWFELALPEPDPDG